MKGRIGHHSWHPNLLLKDDSKSHHSILYPAKVETGVWFLKVHFNIWTIKVFWMLLSWGWGYIEWTSGDFGVLPPPYPHLPHTSLSHNFSKGLSEPQEFSLTDTNTVLSGRTQRLSLGRKHSRWVRNILPGRRSPGAVSESESEERHLLISVRLKKRNGEISKLVIFTPPPCSFFKHLSPSMRPWASYLHPCAGTWCLPVVFGLFPPPPPTPTKKEKRKNKIQLNPVFNKCLLTIGPYDHCPTLRALEQTDLSIWQKFMQRAVLGQWSTLSLLSAYHSLFQL